MPETLITNRDTLRSAVQNGRRVDYVLFWGHKPEPDGSVGKGCLSQWWPARFVVDGDQYASAEHFMMAGKARLFGDEAARARVLGASSPAEAKKIGREVRNFDEEAWAGARFELIVAGNVAKFGQNPPLAAFLLATRDRVLVEASPTDRIWGIGLAAGHPGARDPDQWRGLNLLGFALMEARRRLADPAGGR